MFNFVNRKPLKNKRTAFTLLELVVVTVVIAILAAIAIPNFQGVITRAHDAKAQTTMAAIARDAMYLYRFDNGSTPLDWYNSFNEAVSETPAATPLYLAAETNLTLTLDLPHATSQQIQDAAALAASVTGQNPALAGPSSNPNQLSIFVDGTNNVGMALASAGNCIFGTVIGQEVTTWSAKKDLGADCAGSIAFLDPVTIAALEVRGVSEYSNLTLPITGTLGTPTVAPSSISFSVNFTATPTAPIDSYEVSRNGTILNTTILAPLSSYTDNTAVDGTLYTYSVRAQNSMGYSSAVVTSAVTSYALPQAPAFPILEAGDSIIDIGWAAPTITSAAPISGYRIYRSTSSGPYLFVATLTPETTLSYTDNTLTNGVEYSYQLESYGTGGTSLRSPPSSQVTPITTPAFVVIDTTSQASGSITVNFTTVATAAAPITSVTITRNGLPYLTLNSTDTTFTDSTVTNGTDYIYTFVTNNTLFSSAPISTTTLTSYAAPDAPIFTTQTASTSEISLAWTTITGTQGTPVTGYRVYRSVSGGASVYLTQQPGNSLTDTGLTNGTVYTYQVSTYGTGGEGSRSAASNDLTPITTPSAAPTLTATASNLSNTLSWTAVASTDAAPVQNYSLETSPDGISSWTNIYTGALLTYNHTSLNNGTAYYYRVAATNSQGSGPVSLTANATPIDVPQTPANPTATAGNTQVSLTWQQVSSTVAAPVSGYYIYKATSSAGPYTLDQEIVGGSTTSATSTSLTNNTTYYYKISTYGTAGTGPSSSHFPTAGVTPIVPLPVVSGGTLTSDATYYYRTFTSSGTLTITTASLTVDYLIVAGGGASGWYQNANGGGGAGGVRSFTSQTLNPTSYSAVVGVGGAVPTAVANPGGKGGNSSFNSNSATGGGGGGGGYNSAAGHATTGGSGGGGWGIDGAMFGSTGAAGNQGGYTPVEGYAGGNPRPSDGYFSAGGGGGGAGGAGGNGNSSFGGAGGIGTSIYSSWGLATSTGHNVSGTVYYGGGGGGGKDYRGGGGIGQGGSGGGGNSGTTNTAGLATTGGGGGAGGVGMGGATVGGSGVVIIRYTKASVGG